MDSFQGHKRLTHSAFESNLSASMYCVYTFYKFLQIEASKVEDFKSQIEKLGHENEIEGLVIFGREGINSTISGSGGRSQKQLDSFMRSLQILLGVSQFQIKVSESPIAPFKRFKVKVRDEIVSLGKKEVLPVDRSRHLSPADWHRTLSEEDVIVLDTRNWYETKIGKFAGAVDPNLNEFNEFPEFLKKSEIAKDKKVLIYCTGGIRCEKALVEMQNQGFENVYQLDGGILKYLEEFPNQAFDGECFVFDHRVAVDQNLDASQKFKMCPHCGQPSGQKYSCLKCDSDAWVCEACAQEESLRTCSKNCAHHYRRDPLVKGRKQERTHA